MSTGVLKLVTFRQQPTSETENQNTKYRNNFEFSDSSREGNVVNLFIKTVVQTVCFNSFLFTFLTVVEASCPVTHKSMGNRINDCITQGIKCHNHESSLCIFIMNINDPKLKTFYLKSDKILKVINEARYCKFRVLLTLLQ